MKIAKYLTAIMAAAALAACDDGSVDGSGAGRLTIRLHDAPGDLERAFVQIERVYLVGSGTDSTGHVVLAAPTGFIDLLDLTNGRFADIVQDLAIPTGRYGQLRIVIGDAYIVTEDGEYYATPGTTIPGGIEADGTLRCPSCSTSGFKINFPGGGLEIAEGETVLALDFDVSRSFGHAAGNSGAWVMHPVLHVTDIVMGRSVSGTVALADGVVLPDSCGGTPVSLTQFVPEATGSAGVYTTVTAASASGYGYTLPALPIGTYTMGYQAGVVFADSEETLTFAATATPGTVDLEAGSATVNYTVTGATCS